MFLRCKVRRKDGKQHRYWSVVEITRIAGGRVVQRHVLYLGEINDTQEAAWRRSIEVFEDGAPQPRTLSLFPQDRCAGELADAAIEKVPTEKVLAEKVLAEKVLAEMRATDPPMHYLVGTPKGRLTRLEKHLIAKPWQEARPGVQSLPQRRLGSSGWRKRASSTSWPKAATASPKSERYGGAS